MTVVAGHRAKELAMLHLGPGAGRLGITEGVADGNQVIHQLKAGISAHKHFLAADPHHIGKQIAGLHQTFQVAVIAGIVTVLGGVVVHFEQIHGQIHLMRAGFATGHVEFQVFGLEFGIALFQRSFLGQQLLPGHFTIFCHNTFPLSLWCASLYLSTQLQTYILV